MATRREAREWAVQLLFQLDMNPADDLGPVFHAFWAGQKSDAAARVFTEMLVRGVRENIDRIDQVLRDVAENWDIKRMGVLDRNVIRLGAYEMLFTQDIPPAVTINEAVDIAKFFSSGESGRFVNGILDRIRHNMKRPAR